MWSSTPCELTCSAGKTETGFKAHLGFSGAAPESSDVSRCISPLREGVAVVRCCRDSCLNAVCNFDNCPVEEADPVRATTNDACIIDTTNGRVADGICICTRGNSEAECASLGTAVGTQSGGGSTCLVVDCGRRNLSFVPNLPAGTTQLDLQNNPNLVTLQPLSDPFTTALSVNAESITWLYIQAAPITELLVDTFAHMVSLETLEISLTNLTTIPRHAINPRHAITPAAVGRPCNITPYCSPGWACDGTSCSSGEQTRCCTSLSDHLDQPQTSHTYSGTPDEWQTTSHCWDFVRASSPNCQYEVATEVDGGGTRVNLTGDAPICSSSELGCDTVRSVRVYGLVDPVTPVALKTLTFADNKITTFATHVFQDLKTVKSLKFLNMSAFAFVEGQFASMRSLNSFVANNCGGIKTLPPRLFADSSALKSITFEMNFGLHTIEGDAFSGAGSVTMLRLIELRALPSLGSHVLAGLTGLIDLTIKSSAGGVTTLESDNFAGVVSLERVELDLALLTSIEAGVFRDARNLRQVTISGALKMTSLPAGLFDGARLSVQDVVLASLGFSTIDPRIFEGMNALLTIEISCCNSLQTLAAGLFSLEQLQELKIVNNPALGSIGRGTFANCNALHTLAVTGNKHLARLEAGAFDHAFDHAASSVVINLENNGQYHFFKYYPSKYEV